MSARGNAISPEGKAQAEAELQQLRDVRRPEIVAAIKSAREDGDLKENAEYHAAREMQGMNEARIRWLEHHLASAEVHEVATTGSAAVGSSVSYRDAATGDVSEVTLVHPLEAKLAEGKLSVDSPIGTALVGAREGEQVTLETPRGSKRLKILSVA
jgi:transcription elongation factor GreA